MTPQHHPDPDDLLAYASGASPEWASLVVACHLTYCEECRSDVALMDDVGGVLLAELEAIGDVALPTPPGAARTEPAREKTRIVSDVTRGLPQPIHEYFKDAVPRWRFLAPGVRQIPLSFSVGGIPAKVVEFKPGFTIPEHAHTGLEMVLVLDGELRDSVTKELFGSGDLSRRDLGSTHSQFVTSKDPCICLVVSAAPIEPTSLWGKILKAATGV
jgi:putative transcriptional regulator